MEDDFKLPMIGMYAKEPQKKARSWEFFVSGDVSTSVGLCNHFMAWALILPT